MHIDFTQIIAELSEKKAFTRIFNELRPGSEYIFKDMLPEQTSPEYHVSSDYMMVRSAMAGLVGTDSAYPRTGFVETGKQALSTLKIANAVDLTESAQRRLQLLAAANNLNGPAEVLNFFNKVIVQPHFDTAEWLRAQALTNFDDTAVATKIDWQFGQAKATVLYKRESGWDLPKRTGNDGYGGTTSKFWDDIIAAGDKLGYKIAKIVMNRTTFKTIVNNPVNKILVRTASDDGRTFVVARTNDAGTELVIDGRYTVSIDVYDGAGDVYDISTGTLKQIPFMPDGVVMVMGVYRKSRIYTAGEGSTRGDTATSLGYTHIAPTVEGKNVPGRWGRVFVPQNAQWRLTAEGVTNMIPVVSDPKLYVLMRTEV